LKKEKDKYNNNMNNITEVRLAKKNKDLICLTYIDDKTHYFAKVFYVHNNEKLKIEYEREVKINTYVNKNLKDKTHHISLLEIHEDVKPFDFIIPFTSAEQKQLQCNILIFEHSGNHTMRYYINRISTHNFNRLLQQLKTACDMLQDIDVIHYDLYCESNIMVKKINNRLTLKIIDYGLSYIDETDKTNYDYNIAIESITKYNKKHKIHN